MDIFLAEVEDTTSLSRNGSFLARIRERSISVVVNYVSPFGANGIGGFVAIPSKGQEILVCKLSGLNEVWYYLGSTFSPPKAFSDDKRGEVTADQLQPLDHLDPAMYRATGKPMRYIWKSPLGHQILMSDEYNPDFFNTRIEMRSAGGKSVRCVDSPKIDSILIENEHGDGLKITGITTELPNSPRSVEINSVGPQRLTSLESQIDILVNDGRELNIVNRSSGTNKNPDEPEKYGNINLESSYRDINLRAMGDTGRIFIECLNPEGQGQLIEIETKGPQSTIRLYSNGKIELHAEEDILMEAKRDIRITAGRDVKIGAKEVVDINGAQGNNVDGGEVHLNSGKASVPTTIKVASELDNYDDKGIY